ncbi:CBS domain-containing protein [Nocardia farcinica]|uniref:CBS domain-containing protein n=1 Tax=Nocardia farcinica TaxID=37329 RepID=UPI00189358AE|nr:CBS domain-containing protein [Nocardia farcinica]MBF6445306.1 CBS domain-containing protein [Nocardia farcinica]
MITAHTIMRPDVQFIGIRDSMAVAADRMRTLGVGALPICDGQGHPVGIVTDRDIVVKVIAIGANPATTMAGELAQGADELYTVEVDTELDDILLTMEKHRVRRLPVTDHGMLAGIITEADLSQHLPERTVGEFVEAICAPRLPATESTT